MSASFFAAGYYFYADAERAAATLTRRSGGAPIGAATTPARLGRAPTDAAPLPSEPPASSDPASRPLLSPPEALPTSDAAPPQEATPSLGTAPPLTPGLTAGLYATVYPTPREQQAASKQFVEGHWHGMELLDLVPSLAREYNLPPEAKGLIVDEVSLEAAAAGFLAGDVVVRVGGLSVATLQDLHDATYAVREERAVVVDFIRANRLMSLTLSTEHELGFAMFEAASPIVPGAISPHKELGRSCTQCHIIMAMGGQLPTDAGDILPKPPIIAAGARPPHGDRGMCRACHKIVIPPPIAVSPLPSPGAPL